MGKVGTKYNYILKECASCSQLFKPYSSVHKFCSTECKGSYKYKVKQVTTDSQYKEISGNWYKYLQRLTYAKGREELTTYDLLELIESQDYKCALTGEPLTCLLGKGMTYFNNASLDRINPGTEYLKDNIRFVCRIANIMKWNMSDEELRLWCRKVIDYGS